MRVNQNLTKHQTREKRMSNADKQITQALKVLQTEIHENAVNKGFWPELELCTKGISLEAVKAKVNLGEKIALCHSELSESLEAIRKPGFEPDKHCPEFLNFSIELADTVIRVFDLAEACGISMGEAMLAKMKFNQSRPHKHEKRF